MKTIRVLLSIIFFIPSYPFLFLTYSVLGITIICGIPIFLSIVLALPSGNEDWIDTCWESLEIVILPFWIPFAIWYEYIKTGNFNIQ